MEGEDYRPWARTREYQKHCVWCFQEFTATRWDAILCSVKCRVKRHRAALKRQVKLREDGPAAAS